LSALGKVAHPGPSPEEEFEERQKKELIRKVIRLLPEKERELVELRFLKELPMDDIQARLNISRVTINKYLNQALGRLREILKEQV
jgi:RNA polymerase sigma factor (sigma-70 family)